LISLKIHQVLCRGLVHKCSYHGGQGSSSQYLVSLKAIQIEISVSKIFGNHQATDRPQSQAGSSVAKLARQRAMREGINSDQGIV
jgi:hypothetical protein